MDVLGLVALDGDLLTAGQKVVLVEGVFVLDLLLVGTGYEFHAAGDLVRRRHRDPGGRNVGRGETPISGILMPGHEAGVMRLLDEETSVAAKDVRPKQILDRIENFRMADHVVDPGEQ